MMKPQMDGDASSYIVSDYEGLSALFTEITELPSNGYCRLFKAKRYGRWFLLKCLKPEIAADAAYQQMLRKEFEILMLLQHPSVMQAIGMELIPAVNAYCIVAEWIDGITLAQYLETHPNRAARRRVAIQLAETLDFIHHQQVVHRDLKPSNIMITHNGSYVKIIDFGLADTDSHAILKQPAGTERYMAPEQAEKAAPDVRNDIYSLGVILREMDIFHKIADRCLQPIHQRYQSMDELVNDLHKRRKWHWRWLIAALIAVGIIIALIAKVHDVSRKAADLERHTAELNLQMKVLNHEIIGFDDAHVKQLCVAQWDSDHDGELSYYEAAGVKSIGHVFTQDTLIRSFCELEYFTGLDDIGPDAFMGCKRLESVTIPRNVRYLRQNAFRATALTMVTIPNSVVAMGYGAMDDCTQLEAVIMESVVPNVNDGVHPFSNCPRLSAIFVPDFWITQDPAKQSWKALSQLVCHQIKFDDPVVKSLCVSHWDRNGDGELSIDEAKLVTRLGAVFSGNINIYNFDELRYFTGLTEIESSAFDRCKHLQSVTLPRTVKTIGQNAFIDCDLYSIFIPSGAEKIASTSFSCNPHLTEVVVSPDNPVYDSREGCNAIIETSTNCMVSASITAFIPRSVTSLSDECFNWFNRDELIIPAQITRIGYWSLTSVFGRVYCESPVPPVFDSQGGNAFLFPPSHLGFPEPEIYVPYGSLESYSKAEGWSFFAHRLREYPALSSFLPFIPKLDKFGPMPFVKY